jgi:uncharacterized protein YndB with AHSA1/START domain
MNNINNSEPESVREIISTRLLNAKQELVFSAFSNPLHLAKWWGPKGFTNTFNLFDFTPNGKWDFVMHGPDGVNYKNESEFIEIIKPERIVFNHICKPYFRMTITLTEEGDKTRITWRMLFETSIVYENVKNYVGDANQENFDRLENELLLMNREEL